MSIMKKNTLTASWCCRIGEAVALKGNKCLRKKEPICDGCIFNEKHNVDRL